MKDKDYNDWSDVGNVVEYNGKLWRITEIQMEMCSDGESYWSGDDPVGFVLADIETGKDEWVAA
tara:strand:+ start:229 stop:420 length:192 start_codon:yes stop_codon:yes gene_type:complete